MALKVCTACGKEYTYEKRQQMSTRRCPECHAARKQSPIFGGGHRPMGHKTRGVHKKVRV